MALTLAKRTQRMRPSAIREILKVTEQPGVLSLAGGLPSATTFPIEAIGRASERLLAEEGPAALQYGASEGLPALREWVARRLSRDGWQVNPDQVLITTGSQQGLDLLGKVLLDAGTPLLVEQPTYLGALQAFAPYEPDVTPWSCDAQGPLPAALASGRQPGVAYVVPNFQNPTGHCLDAGRRRALAQQLGLSTHWLIEDDPYGELWFDGPPPPPVAALAPGQVVYLGSFSKVLAPGLRVGYLVMPRGDLPVHTELRGKLLQAKQAADLHTPSFTQRLIARLLHGGFDLDAHLHGVRRQYGRQRDAMARALERHLPPGCRWAAPRGGMFFWVEAPEHVDTTERLGAALQAGVAYVPGAAFYPDAATAPRHALRLSFVTLSEDQIDEAVARLAPYLR